MQKEYDFSPAVKNPYADQLKQLTESRTEEIAISVSTIAVKSAPSSDKNKSPEIENPISLRTEAKHS
ncbi:MAG: hypothetical protein GZ090_06500 [Oxalobacteraceae bacterium]|nr:hypothetical protein [Oxalobacteraceae bacterium]